jgi:hypothetical protein
MISNIEKIIFFVILLLIIFLLYNNYNTNENFTCSFIQEDRYKPTYILQKPGDIINPLNSIYYIDFGNTLLTTGNYHIRMFNKTNHDIVNYIDGKYILKLDLSKQQKSCDLFCLQTELIYIKNSHNIWFVFNNKGELYQIKDKLTILHLNKHLQHLLHLL